MSLILRLRNSRKKFRKKRSARQLISGLFAFVLVIIMIRYCYRHSFHISYLKSRAPDGMIGIEVEGKQVYIDPKTIHKIQDCKSDPVFEGHEW